MRFLLDTNVLSEIRKPPSVANPNVASWFASVTADQLFLSVMVVGEIRQGITRLERRDPQQAAIFEAWQHELLTAFSDRIVPLTLEVAQTWGRLNVPDPLPEVDGLLAATAMAHDWTLVTRNTKDVARTGVRLLNPFEPVG